MPTRKQLEQQFIEDRAFWGSVSARWRGLASGLILGGIAGAVLGVLVSLAYTVATGTPPVVASTAGLGIVGLFSAGGALVGGTLQGLAGSLSGAVASALVAKKEIEQGPERAMDRDIKLPPIPFDSSKKQPLFHWKIMAMGAVVAGTAGAFLAATGMLPASVGYLLLGEQLGTLGGAAAAALTMGAFGTVFGIGFKPWQAFKKWTDGFFEARLTGRTVASMTALKEQLLTLPPEREESRDLSFGYRDKILEQRENSTLQSPSL